MIKRYLFLFLFLCFSLLANTQLNNVYYVDSNEVMLDDVISGADGNILLFKLSKAKHTKKVRAKELISTLKNYGYKTVKSKHQYIKFIKKSPIDTSRLESALYNYYKDNYNEIDIQNIFVNPRTYIESLPKEYTVSMKKNSFLKKDGVISIKTSSHKKLFFNYTIDAVLDVYISKHKIKKDAELSLTNITKKRVVLEKFRAKPFQPNSSTKSQAKHHISANKVITVRDVVELNLITRNSQVQITMNNNNINISFSAKALQNGKLNDIIKVQKSNGKILRVKVTGKNMAEIR
jgi:flagella basal body P-ring formation protein FlgA